MAKKYKTHEEFINDILNINKNISVIGKYKNARTKILCKCKVCEYEWMDTPNNLLRHNRQKGCPMCNNNKSYGEERVNNFLLKNRIKYTQQKTFDDLIGVNGGKLSYDFLYSNV